LMAWNATVRLEIWGRDDAPWLGVSLT